MDTNIFGELSAMRIRFEANSKFWVVITEVSKLYVKYINIKKLKPVPNFIPILVNLE